MLKQNSELTLYLIVKDFTRIYMEKQKSLNSLIILKKNKEGGITLPDFNTTIHVQ